MSYETILLETHGRVGLITLNRPQALNALNAQLVSEVNRALDGFEADANIGCIVITGSTKAFAAGADIKEMADLTYPQIYMDDLFSDSDRVANRRKPILSLGHPAFERLCASDVFGLFELARMHAEVAVGRLHQLLEIAEAEGIIDGECAHNAKAQALVNQPIECVGAH